MKKAHYSFLGYVRKKKTRLVIDDDRLSGLAYLGKWRTGIQPRRQRKDCYVGTLFAAFVIICLVLLGILVVIIGF